MSYAELANSYFNIFLAHIFIGIFLTTKKNKNKIEFNM